MRLFLSGSPSDDGTLHLLARVEGSGGIGDALLTLERGQSVAGVPFAALLALVTAHGYIDLPASDDACDEALMPIAEQAYLARFPGAAVPMPFGISDRFLTEVLFRAIEVAAPVPPDFDWWSHLPPGAMA